MICICQTFPNLDRFSMPIYVLGNQVICIYRYLKLYHHLLIAVGIFYHAKYVIHKKNTFSPILLWKNACTSQLINLYQFVILVVIIPFICDEMINISNRFKLPGRVSILPGP